MTAKEIKRKLTGIFSAAMLGRLKKVILRYWRNTPTILKALATLVIALNAAWQLYSRVLSTPSEVPSKGKAAITLPRKPSEVASQEKMAFPLPDKPSIAVLPFAYTSGDPKHEYLSDGITDDIITALSKCSQLFVIGRNSTFTYKGKPVKFQQVSEEMGVRYE